MPETLNRPGIPSSLDSRGRYEAPPSDNGGGNEEKNLNDDRLNNERMLEATNMPGYLSDFDQLKTNLTNLQEDLNATSHINDTVELLLRQEKNDLVERIREDRKIKDDERDIKIKAALDDYESKLNDRKISLQKEVKESVETTIEARRELAHENFLNIVNQSFDHLDFVADKEMHGEFPYPYDSRQGAYYLSTVFSEIKNELAKPDLQGEARQWMETLHDGVSWAKAQYSIAEGLNLIPYYYGALDGMAMCLRDQKHKISATDLKSAFKMDIRGAKKTSEATRGITVGAGKITKEVMIKIPDRKNRGIAVGIRERKEPLENIRETAVNFQDDFFFWRNAVAAASQYDYINPASEGLLHHSVFREGVELKLITDLFASRGKNGAIETVMFNNKTVPKEILNFYTMTDSAKNREKYTHTMQALLELGIRDKLAGLVNATGVLDTQKYTEMITSINRRISEIEGKQKKVELSFKERLSALVVKQGITFDIGSAGVGPLSWQWKYSKEEDLDGKGQLQYNADGTIKYKVDEKGNDIYRREWEFGGISQSGDWYTPEYWVDHNQFYDLTAKLRSKLWPASCDAGRKAERSKSPNEKPGPRLEDVKRVGLGGTVEIVEPGIESLDPWLYQEVRRVIAEDDELIITNKGPMKAGEWRKQNKFDIDPNIRLAFKEMLWFWETPYTGKDGKRMFFPSFIPHRFKLSFFDQVIIKRYDPVNQDPLPHSTFAEELRKGSKLSEQNWDSIRQFDWDRWLVNINMSERWLRFLAEPGDDRAQEALVGGPGTIKEIIKRAELGLRGWYTNFTNKKGKPASADSLAAEIAIVGQMPILAAAKPKDHEYGGLMGENIKLDTERNAWLERLASWINMAEYMPPDKKNMIYGQSLSLIMATTGNVLYRHALEYGTAEHHDRVVVMDHLRTILANSNDKLVTRN